MPKLVAPLRTTGRKPERSRTYFGVDGEPLAPDIFNMRAALSIFLSVLLLFTSSIPSAPSCWRPSLLFGADGLPGVMFAWEAELVLDVSMQLEVAPWINESEDLLYILPTQEDIEDLLKFHRSHKAGFKYTPEGFDCDDFATEFKYWATVWGMRRYQKSEAATLVGKAYVHLHGYYEIFQSGRPVSGYHVLNFVVRSDGKILLIEPQSGKYALLDGFIYEDSLTVLRIEY